MKIFKKMFDRLKKTKKSKKNIEISIDVKSTPKEITAFENKINNGKWIVKYHADWCGHCQQLKPTWKKFIDTSDSNKYNIASIENEAFNKMSNQPNVRGFPTIQLLNDGNFLKEHEGDRTPDNFKAFYDSVQTSKTKQSGGSNKKTMKQKKIKTKKNKQKKNQKNKK